MCAVAYLSSLEVTSGSCVVKIIEAKIKIAPIGYHPTLAQLVERRTVVGKPQSNP